MPTYQQRLTANNLKIDEITAMARNLPDEGDTKPYIELEYIQSNGLQYIDTGIKPKSTTFINFMGTFLQKNGALMGSRTDGDIDKYYVTTYFDDLTFNYDNNSSVSNVTFGSANVYDITSTYWRLDSQVVNNYSINNFPNYSIFLFALNSSGNTTAYATGKIYYFKIYENNVLVRNFIPVKRKRDGEVCLYDLVNNMFFTNQGTSSFVAGPEKVETTMNIFVQDTEPEVKKGIWLQTDETMEHIYYDNFVSTDTWELLSTTIPYTFHDSACAYYDGFVYLAGTSDNTGTAVASSYYFYKYDINNNTWTRLNDLPYPCFRSRMIAYNGYLYLFGSYFTNYTNYAYKYEIDTGTWTRLTDVPYQFGNGTAAYYDGNVYLLGGSWDRSYMYRYNISTNTYTQLATAPIEVYSTNTTVDNDGNIYVVGGGNAKTSIYKYNISTNTYTKLNVTLPYNYYDGYSVYYDGDIYIIWGTISSGNQPKYTYKYNIQDGTLTRLSDTPIIFSYGGGIITDNNIYTFSNTDVQHLTIGINTNNILDNSVLISNNNGYITEMFSNICNVIMNNKFADAWFYTTNDGLITNIPTYYGDGTQWINIKNPPQVQNNE